MSTVITLGILFVMKVLDNAISTAKTIFIQRNRWLLAAVAVVVSDFIYFWLTKRIVTSDSVWAIAVVAVAGGVGCALACLTGQKLSRDRIFVNVVMCDDKDAMQAFRDFLAEHHITNVCCDSYTRDWNRKTITVTAYAETRAESSLIDYYIENSSMKFKRITQKL